MKLILSVFILSFLFYSINSTFAKPALAVDGIFSVESQEAIAFDEKDKEKKPEKPKVPSVIMLGDSLTSGYGIAIQREAPLFSYAKKLEKLLHKFGYPVKILNSSVTGSTTAHAYSRLLTFIKKKKERRYVLAIIALGYDDSYAKFPVKKTYKYLERIMEKLEENNIPMVLMGMRAPADSSPEYAQNFNSIYPKLSSQFNTPFYPFLLEGVFMRPKYALSDLAHPNNEGMDLIAQKTAPLVMYALFEALNGRKPVKYPEKKEKQQQQEKSNNITKD